jgi:hypothetical protein
MSAKATNADYSALSERVREVRLLFSCLMIWTVSLGPALAQGSPSSGQQKANPPAATSTITEPNAMTGSAAAKPSDAASPKSESPITELIKNIQSAVQALAIIVAGIWAYFKFINGRVFKARLEPSIAGTALKKGEYAYVNVKITLKNVGLSKVQIMQKGTGFELYSTGPGWSRETLSADWTRHGTFSAFHKHGWIEPGETITDEQLIVVPTTDTVAYRVEFEMSGGKNYWSANGIIQAEEPETDTDAKSLPAESTSPSENCADGRSEEKGPKPESERHAIPAEQEAKTAAVSLGHL